MKYMLKNMILKVGKSQWQICQELNWPEAKLSRFVTGRRTPSPEDLDALAPVLGVSRNELQDALSKLHSQAFVHKSRSSKQFGKSG